MPTTWQTSSTAFRRASERVQAGAKVGVEA